LTNKLKRGIFFSKRNKEGLNMFYFLWIPPFILLNFLASYFSNKLSITHENKWYWLLYLTTVIPSWAVICKYSNNVVFDAILYDLILLVSYSGFLIFLTKASLNIYNIFGLVLIFIGVILFKL